MFRMSVHKVSFNISSSLYNNISRNPILHILCRKIELSGRSLCMHKWEDTNPRSPRKHKKKQYIKRNLPENIKVKRESWKTANSAQGPQIKCTVDRKSNYRHSLLGKQCNDCNLIIALQFQTPQTKTRKPPKYDFVSVCCIGTLELISDNFPRPANHFLPPGNSHRDGIGKAPLTCTSKIHIL